MHQMNVNTAFLNGWMDEGIYMVQPSGYVNKAYTEFLCKLSSITSGSL